MLHVTAAAADVNADSALRNNYYYWMIAENKSSTMHSAPCTGKRKDSFLEVFKINGLEPTTARCHRHVPKTESQYWSVHKSIM